MMAMLGLLVVMVFLSVAREVWRGRTRQQPCVGYVFIYLQPHDERRIFSRHAGKRSAICNHRSQSWHLGWWRTSSVDNRLLMKRRSWCKLRTQQCRPRNTGDWRPMQCIQLEAFWSYAAA